MTYWTVDTRKGLIVGGLLLAFVVAVDNVLVWLAITNPISLGTFAIGLALLMSLGLIGLLAYWLYGLVEAGFSLDRNALIIHWGPTEQTIPIGSIERVVVGSDIEGAIRFRGGGWPGHFVGFGEADELGAVLFYGTLPPRRQIYVVTPGLTYGLSPADYEDFLDALRKRIQMGPTQVLEQTSVRPNFLDWRIWHDRVGMARLGSGLFSLALLVGFLAFRFPSLPDQVPLHFDLTGSPDRISSRLYVFVVPLIGLSTWVVNGALGWLLSQRERLASYLLWSGSLVVQVFVWVAALTILRWA